VTLQRPHAAHVTSEIAAIEELRRTAGVTGQSTQPPLRQPFSVSVFQHFSVFLNSRIGDIFSWALVIFTAAGFLALLGQSLLPATGEAKTVAP
jgi:hypothetical protein